MRQLDGLAEPHQREVIRVHVRAQDAEMNVPESYDLIRKLFGLPLDEIRLIEQEGLAGNWPHL
jgi:hypothetical protein